MDQRTELPNSRCMYNFIVLLHYGFTIVIDVQMVLTRYSKLCFNVFNRKTLGLFQADIKGKHFSMYHLAMYFKVSM